MFKKVFFSFIFICSFRFLSLLSHRRPTNLGSICPLNSLQLTFDNNDLNEIEINSFKQHITLQESTPPMQLAVLKKILFGISKMETAISNELTLIFQITETVTFLKKIQLTVPQYYIYRFIVSMSDKCDPQESLLYNDAISHLENTENPRAIIQKITMLINNLKVVERRTVLYLLEFKKKK